MSLKKYAIKIKMENTLHEKETVNVDGCKGYNTIALELHKSIQCTKYYNIGKNGFAFGGTNIKIWNNFKKKYILNWPN